ncbi:hypothetical protein BC939DRAFT_524601 [Gamsiella multidivaricata]|uniref:uncharacterized protein n=1 Tax=Gamsiella multidivaricata TaxID=101098 RepID=UPI0022203A97|nr:uncharacterized protein BC939DRAFT_524601 [Gamsiella multidivaricata]KAI7832320.1 hypothetical protein BC939DRAFT_524601 [Gamsiella multidivaricata]
MSVATSSAASAASRSTQYTVLNASLERLQKNLETLEQNVEITVVQSEWTKRLLTIHSSLLMASARVLKDDEQLGQGQGQDEDQEES